MDEEVFNLPLKSEAVQRLANHYSHCLHSYSYLIGIEGKMFWPMAQTVGFAIFGALILSLTYIPMMCVRFTQNISHKETLSDRMMNFFNALYHY